MKIFLFYFAGFTYCISRSCCWQYFTALGDLTLTNSEKEPVSVHSEYIFGDCKRRRIRLQAHIHKDHMEILGKIIVRGWLKIRRIPTCIILRAKAYHEDLLRSTAYNFQMCVPRITYCHTQTRFKYYYYEWYLPTDMIGGMNWDIYFFGPPFLVWQ